MPPVLPPAPAPTDAAVFSGTLLRLHNETRAAASLAPLTPSTSLQTVAQTNAQANAANNTLVHTANLLASAAAAGYSPQTIGENIALATSTGDAAQDAATLFALWMNSPPHRANILQSAFVDVGFGYAVSDGIAYGASVFGAAF